MGPMRRGPTVVKQDVKRNLKMESRHSFMLNPVSGYICVSNGQRNIYRWVTISLRPASGGGSGKNLSLWAAASKGPPTYGEISP